ncbi:DUF58 domain-containing protein [Paracoccus sp. (in: a-proteobacteria)]|uniref:DUF58 domain-containing protein n=1 Tax=Paracoccus sp. TaxID=267 RepID=UPI00396C7FF3
MVGAARWQQAPGIALAVDDLLALREQAAAPDTRRPATRRAGILPSRHAGSGMDLREIRAYVPGDDMRRMDPSATARTGKPHVRALHEDRDDVTLLIADFRAPMLWGTGSCLRSVKGAAHLASIGWRAVGRGGNVGLIVMGPGQAALLPPAGGDRQMALLCRMLADLHAQALDAPADADHALPQALGLAARMVPAGAEVVLATAPDGWQGAETPLTRLARGRRLAVALILDPLDVMPPARALPVQAGGQSLLTRLTPVDLSELSASLMALGAEPRQVAP